MGHGGDSRCSGTSEEEAASKSALPRPQLEEEGTSHLSSLPLTSHRCLLFKRVLRNELLTQICAVR